MGCAPSKIDSLEAVQLCKNRKMLIEQAVQCRSQFASGHVAYIESMGRVSSALGDYVEGEGYNRILLDAFTTPTFTPVKKINSGFISLTPKSYAERGELQSDKSCALKLHYSKSGGRSPCVTVEEKPQSPEAYSHAHRYGVDGFFAMHSVPMSSSFPQSSPNLSSSLTQSTHWDSFWDPFTSLDYYGYPVTSGLNQTILDGNDGVSKVEKREIIHGLAEHVDCRENLNVKTSQIPKSFNKEDTEAGDVNVNGSEGHTIKDNIAPDFQLDDDNNNNNRSVSKTQNDNRLGSRQPTMADCEEAKKQIPGFTVYVNTGPTHMEEAVKDLDAQFRIACNAAREVSAMLDATKAQNSSISNDFTYGNNYASNSDLSDDSRFCYSHQSTLDKMHLWEKKLYEEVKAGARMRLAYEKKCTQLKNLEEKKASLPSINRTRSAIGDLVAHIKVSMHTVETISKRIEILKDEELQPQLLQLMQGLGRMWKVMADSHQLQKHILEEAKNSAAKSYSKAPPSFEPHQVGRSVVNLETELRNWRACFETWIISQRSYLHALTGWLLCCLNANPITPKQSFSPGSRFVAAQPAFNICVQWSRLLDSINELPVLDGIDFFVEGLVSLCQKHLRGGGGGDYPNSSSSSEAGKVDHVDEEEEEAFIGAANKVVCSGMSVSVGALTEFATVSAEGYADLLKKWEENKQCEDNTEGV
ncbi:hypothetical protein DM860_015449 [Cuscuta australis]|uniref:DUF632 domain-containing protein n=1 Tax=Cuscuta australis TaxID=267555 RepID=A0A328EB68_9ASTE|nr:hypothetical protein DM860_015449 [Cuscuta australis]